MPFTFVSPAVPDTQIKVRWKEQYGSSGFNKKFAGIIPAGIYRGLTLSTSGSNNTVTVVPDSVHQDHLAVYETATGFSLTFRDASNTTYSLNCSDASLLSTTIVITLLASYAEGSDTTAAFVAYTLTEFNALSASAQGELVVLGTVVNPAGGNVISGSAITTDRRTNASLDQTLLLWRSLLTNTGFERAPDAEAITGFEVEGWVSTANWHTNSSDVETGTRALELNVTGAGTYTEHFRQYIGTSVTAGQRTLVKLSKKVVGLATGGTGNVVVGYTKTNGGTATELAQTFVINATDGSYQPLSFYFIAPTGALMLQYIGVQVTAAVYGSAGAKIRIDNVRALMEPVSIDDQLTLNDHRFRDLFTNVIVLEDVTSTSYSDIGAALTFLISTPASEGSVILGRKDQVSASLPPALQLLGRMIGLGSGLLGSAGDARKARISTPYSSSLAVTLINESLPATGTEPGIRFYATSTGQLFATINASYDGANWNKDLSGTSATLFNLNSGNIEQFGMVADTPWATWTQISKMSVPQATLVANNAFSPVMELFDAGGNRRVVFDHNGIRAGHVIEMYQSWLDSPVNTMILPAMLSTDSNTTMTASVHSRGYNGWLFAASAAPIYYPLDFLKLNDMVFAISPEFYKNTSNTNTVTLELVYHDITGEHSIASATNNANATGFQLFFFIIPAHRVVINQQLYVKMTPGGGISPAADHLFSIQVQSLSNEKNGWGYDVTGEAFFTANGDSSLTFTLGAGSSITARTTAPFLSPSGGTYAPQDDGIAILEWGVNSVQATGSTPGATIIMGFHSNPIYGPGLSHGIYFSKIEGNANWQFNIADNSGSSTVDTGISVTGGLQRFRIEAYGGNQPGGRRYLGYINGALVAQFLSTASHKPSDELGISFIFTYVSAQLQMTLLPVVCRYMNNLSDDAL